MKKDLNNLFLGLLFGYPLYTMGVIDFHFQSVFSFPPTVAVGIIIVFSIFNILKRVLKRNS